MKRLVFCLPVLLLAAFPVLAQDVKIRFMTYNMLFEHNKPAQPERQWINRYPNIVRTLQDLKPDVVGTQELQSYQVTDLVEHTGYGRVGCTLKGNYSASNEEENAAILYRKDRLRLLASGNFWFSDTPDIPSPATGIHYNRMCTWGKFEVMGTGKVFYVFNSHFYYEPGRDQLRMQCARVLKERALRVAGDYPVFINGDLNAEITGSANQYLLEDGVFFDSRAQVATPKGPEGTWFNFDLEKAPDTRLDHILVNDRVQVLSYEIIESQRKTGAIESDHLPVLIEASF